MRDDIPWRDEPAWRVRLLQQIQDLAAHRTGMLRRGYQQFHGHDELAREGWRAELILVEEICGDLERRALASGIPRPWIDDVLVLGRRGIRYIDHYPDPRVGTNRAREALIERLADDVWHLQHMAVIAAARRDRLYGQGVLAEPQPAAAGQFERNMITYWTRASGIAGSIDLTRLERKQLWASTVDDWRRIVAATTATYDDLELNLWWLGHAHAGIERMLGSSLDPFTTTAIIGDIRGHTLPTPTDMIAAAEEALVPPRPLRHPHSRPAAGASEAIETMLPEPGAWSAQPPDPPTAAPDPPLGPDTGIEPV
ncbi:hypothetical protein [Nocardia transvalensis]|uniref:hypothetical protein n=1 Tax=Nocardia transvalensis TaxID=37333 RepID=UPI001894F8B7|nr:hypothetical protein [Nocardia transvalensis]MBF6331819.1 hypothetical protein [Nocardia transvalensis]